MVICQNDLCGSEIARKKRSAHDLLKYCSKSCAAVVNNKNRERKLKICPKCGTCVLIKKSRLCISCRSDVVLEKQVNKSTTLQELRDRYSTAQYHSKIRGLSRSIFKGPYFCWICRYTAHVDVCHVVAVKDFPMTATLAEVNHPNNLVALCPNHHWEFDAGIITVENFVGTARYYSDYVIDWGYGLGVPRPE